MSTPIPTPLSAARPNARTTRRKTISVTSQSLVKEQLLFEKTQLPWLIEPQVIGVDLAKWASEHKAYLEKKVLQYGAVLFRGFAITSPDTFNEVISALSPGALEYMFRASPRTRVGGNIYTSTDYPADQEIFAHNEHSYSPRFPLRLFFYAHQPSITGGETPIGSTRELMKLIPEQIIEKFRQKQILYVRNYGDGFGLPWQAVFQSEDRAEVEAYCASVGIEVQWKSNNRLRTQQVGPALVKHPRTEEEVWFNHATFFHISTLPQSIQTSLRQNFSINELPTNTFYGDGSEIEADVLQQLRAAYNEALVSFAWQQGDVLFMDNMLAVHSRQPFTGSRKIYAAMAEPYLSRDVQL
jgi:alpha-ketoglutarate-dependent taurine dioxygenase